MGIRNEQRLADMLMTEGSIFQTLAEVADEYAEVASRVGRDTIPDQWTADDVADYKSHAAHDEWLRKRVRPVPKIIVDNVADYAWEKGLTHPSELAALNPPFPEFWVEFRYKKWFLGGLFLADGDKEEGWVYTVHLCGTQRGEALTAHAPVRFSVTPDGSGDELDDLWALSQEPDGTDWKQATVALLAGISFLNCTNTQRIKVRRPLRDKKFGSSRGPKPVLTFHLLHIMPNQKQVKSERWYQPGDDSETALHICRGHFRTYTEERPLFGKYAGTFWVPAHTRGSAEHGVAMKDYEVHAPDSEKDESSA